MSDLETMRQDYIDADFQTFADWSEYAEQLGSKFVSELIEDIRFVAEGER